MPVCADRLPSASPGRSSIGTAQRTLAASLAIALITATAARSAGQTATVPKELPDRLTREDEAQQTGKRLREGARLVDQLGNFQLTSDRATFTTADGQHRFDGLPNLNLERIVRTLRDHPDDLVWSVSGMVTEYQGANYILITRAVLKSKQSRGEPIPGKRPPVGEPKRSTAIGSDARGPA